MSDEHFFIAYTLTFDDGRSRRFEARLHPDTLDLISAVPSDPPAWTALAHHRCPNCPLDPAAHARCPVAVNLSDLIAFFMDLKSTVEVDVRIETNQRDYARRVPLQTVASSLMGIYMVTSGCPVLNKMRPMVETHLPFATWQETTYRMISMYLMAQFFAYKEGGRPDWDLTRLVEFFQDVYQVNNAFFARLDSVRLEESGEASLNGVSILNASVNLACMSIEMNDLEHWRQLFLAHWGKGER